jgi:hypothetical protein
LLGVEEICKVRLFGEANVKNNVRIR